MELAINGAIVDRARAGETLTEAELVELDAVDVLSLGMLADEVRRRRVGATVTYTRVAVADGATADGLSSLEQDDVEARLLRPGATLDETVAAVALVRRAVGNRSRVTGFSLADVASRGWGPLRSVLDALRAAGLDAIVEAPIDVVGGDDLDAIAEAGLGLVALSVQRMPADRVIPVMAARRLLEGRPWIAAVAPLSREQSVAAPTTGYHDVRMVALARLALPGVGAVQIDWQQYGPKLAQVALTFGASHLDNVSPVDDPALGSRRASVEEVRRNIAAAGFVPAAAGAPA
ncbi:MAG: hypothetical protein R2712_31460 [Vicinamibacterales bacterium]